MRIEEELYKWSADRFNKYPFSGNDIDESYKPQLEAGRFIPLTAVDDSGDVIGHFIIRYPRDDDDSSVQFGFVIGFKEYAKRECKMPIGTWNCTDIELFIEKRLKHST